VDKPHFSSNLILLFPDDADNTNHPLILMAVNCSMVLVSVILSVKCKLFYNCLFAITHLNKIRTLHCLFGLCAYYIHNTA